MSKISTSSAVGQIGVIAVFCATALFLSSAANAVGKWERLLNGHVVQDYYSPVKREFLDVVNYYHMRPKEKLHNQSVVTYNVGDINYTLKHIPNHPLALRRATITCTEHPDLIHCAKVKDLFLKAVEWDPQQPNTRVLYGVFLQIQEYEQDALEQYQLALTLKPGMADAHYNIALIYYKQENWEKAAEHAKAAYANGHRAPSLRRKLSDKGLM